MQWPLRIFICLRLTKNKVQLGLRSLLSTLRGTDTENRQTVHTSSQAKKLDGIGESIAAKIDEYLKTGTVDKLEKIRSEESTAVINLLSGVVGIGPAKASDLYSRGIKTIEDLVFFAKTL